MDNSQKPTSELTKRELFAAMAMQGFAANSNVDFYPRDAADEAVKWANALIVALSDEQSHVSGDQS